MELTQSQIAIADRALDLACRKYKVPTAAREDLRGEFWRRCLISPADWNSPTLGTYLYTQAVSVISHAVAYMQRSKRGYGLSCSLDERSAAGFDPPAGEEGYGLVELRDGIDRFLASGSSRAGDAELIAMLAAELPQVEIAAALGIGHTAVSARVKGLRARLGSCGSG